MKIRSGSICFFAIFLMILFCCTELMAENDKALRVVTGAGVRMRTEPNTAAPEVKRLLLGTIVAVSETSEKQDVNTKKKETWYKVVHQESSQSGWVFGELTRPFDPIKKADIFRSLITDNLRKEESKFGDNIELFKLADKLSGEFTDRMQIAEFSVFRLQALQKALSSYAYQNNQGSELKDNVLKQYQADLIYSEPAGTWLIKPELFWNLHDKYKDIAIGDQIAWAASQQPLAGETEGYLPAMLSVVNMTQGKYLKLYPKGEFANTALESICDYLGQITSEQISEDRLPKEDIPAFRKDIGELMAYVKATQSPAKEKVLKILDQLLSMSSQLSQQSQKQ